MGNRGGKVPSGDVETPSLKTLHPPITPPPPTDQPSHSPTWNDGISHQFSNQAGGDSDNCATPAGLLTPPLLATSSVDVQSSPGPVLSPDDLVTVLTELIDVCADWYNIGLTLKLSPGALNAVKGPHKDPKDCLRDMLIEWLNTSEPSWAGLVQALRSPILGHRRLADNLDAKYCTRGRGESCEGHHSGPAYAGVVGISSRSGGSRETPSKVVETQSPLMSFDPTINPPSMPSEMAVQPVVPPQTGEWIEELEAEFESLVRLALNVVRRQQLRPNELKQRLSWLEELFPYSTSAIQEVWKALGNYWNYFSYAPLKEVVLQFADEGDLMQHLKVKITKYASEVDRFKKATKLNELVKVEFPKQDHHVASLKELKVKIDQSTWLCRTIDQVEKLMRTLTGKQAISKLLLIFKEACTEDNCICISFLVATEVGDALLNTACDFCRNNRITEITLESDRHIYYTMKLEPFADDLRMAYETQIPDFHARQWPPPPTHKVFNLAMVHSNGTIRRQQRNEEQLRFIVEGDVSSAVSGKVIVQVENLLNEDHSKSEKGKTKRKVILIEGAPGAGKSTLAWHICQRWKDKEIFQEIQITFYVQLRDPVVQSAKSLADLLPVDAEETEKGALVHIKACYGRRVLFVLDGWDEFEPGLREGSLFHKLICNPSKLNLHYSTLLITSRPIASREVQPYASSRIEILGFLPAEVSRYFEEALRDPQAVQNLQEQLKERPVIEASCYLPLNAAIVAHIFMELNYTLPTTLHGVFSAVVCGCIRRYLKRQSGEEVEIPSLDKIPRTLQEEFHSLCNLAYEGSMENKVTFSGQDMESHGLSAKQNVLDLMQVVQSFASCNSKLCHFLHLSVQELLTALMISKLSESEQVQIFNEIFNNPRFTAVFQFYAAFTELKTKGIKEIIARIAQSEDKQPLLNLMNCLYEAQSATVCCFVASRLTGGLSLDQVILSPLNCLSVGYFLSCLCQYPDEHFTVDLTKMSLDCDKVRFLAKGLSNDNYGSLGVEQPTPCVVLKPIEHGFKYLIEALAKNRSVVQLQLSHCHLKMTEDDCPLLEEMLSKNSSLQIDVLNLAENSIGANGLGCIAKGLQHNTGLVNLSLAGCSLEVTEDNGPLLEEMLNENKSLMELDVEFNSFGAIGLQYIAKGLSQNTGLVKVSLHYCSLKVTEDNGPLLEQMLKENKSLKELDLRSNSFGAIGLQYIAKGLRHNTGLVKVSLHYCTLEVTEDNGPLLEEMLSKNKSLKELELGSNSFGAIGLRYIAKGLSHNTGLVKLSLSSCSLEVTDDSGPIMEEMLKKNKSLKELDLGTNFIGVNGLRHIAKGLSHNTRLVKLSMCYCSLDVTEDNSLTLEEMLKRNSTLQELDLSGHNITTTKGLLTLGECLGANRGLRILDMTGLFSLPHQTWEQFVLCLKDSRLSKLNIPQFLDVGEETDTVNESRRQQGLPLLEVLFY